MKLKKYTKLSQTIGHNEGSIEEPLMESPKLLKPKDKGFNHANVSNMSLWIGSESHPIHEALRSLSEGKREEERLDEELLKREIEGLKKLLQTKMRFMDHHIVKVQDLKHMCSLTFVPERQRMSYKKQIQEHEKEIENAREEWIELSEKMDLTLKKIKGTTLENTLPVKELSAMHTKIVSQFKKLQSL